MTRIWRLPTDAECREILNYILDSQNVELWNDYSEVPVDRTYKITINNVTFIVGVAKEAYKENPTRYALLEVVAE